MGKLAFIIAMIVPHLALAESEADLAQKGQNLAKGGRYSEAIDAFKAADKLEVRASHACLIALAYTRRELWPQAELWLDTCQKRATPTDPLPDWFSDMTAQIAERLKSANAAAVDIHVTPADANARITISSFAADESIEPRTIHLAAGHHVFVAKAPGFVDAQVAIDLGVEPQRVVIEMHRPLPPPPNHAGYPLYGIGAALVLGGAVSYAWMSYEYEQSKQSFEAWGDHIGSYRTARWLTIGGLGTGAACLVVGYLLHRNGEHPDVPAVAATPVSGGAVVTVGWER